MIHRKKSTLPFYYGLKKCFTHRAEQSGGSTPLNCKNMHSKLGVAIISATVREISKISLSLGCLGQMLCGIPRYLSAPQSAHSRRGRQTFTVPNAHCLNPANSVPAGLALWGEKRSRATPRTPSPPGTGARLRWRAAHGGQPECSSRSGQAASGGPALRCTCGVLPAIGGHRP